LILIEDYRRALLRLRSGNSRNGIAVSQLQLLRGERRRNSDVDCDCVTEATLAAKWDSEAAGRCAGGELARLRHRSDDHIRQTNGVNESQSLRRIQVNL
jgi:hypothetical protein